RGGRDMADLSYTIGAGDDVDSLLGFLNQGLEIDTSLTPPAGSPTPGATVDQIAGDGAAEGRLIVVGNLGEQNALSLAGNALTSTNSNFNMVFGEGQDAAGITSNPVGESVFTSYVAYDSLGTPLTVNLT